MLIGELSKRAGVSVDTIRFYERKGLLHPASIASNNYKHYNEQSLQRLDIILKSKKLGFTLREIRELLDKLESDTFTLECKQQIIDDKLQDIDDRVQELQEMRQTLMNIRQGLVLHLTSNECTMS